MRIRQSTSSTRSVFARTVLLGAVLALPGLLGTPPETLTAEQRAILERMSLVQVGDGSGGTIDTIRITGVNVQIVNGLGATNGDPSNPYGFDAATNGAGNLVLGYNERVLDDPRPRTGSHNLVIGPGHEFSGTGGLVVGQRNRIRDLHAVAFGDGNRSVSRYASVLGGANNSALETHATVCGGAGNEAAWSLTTVLGGEYNLANGLGSVIVGGTDNRAHGLFASVLGGELNRATGHKSTVSGGSDNRAIGFGSSVSGGLQRSTHGNFDWAAGALWQEE